MSVRSSRGAIVGLLVAIACALPGVTAAPASAKVCSAGYVHAVIGHAQKCLRRGEFCAVRYRRQYPRYGFICENVRGYYRLEPI